MTLTRERRIAARSSSRAVVYGLALFEAKRMLLHPLTLFGLAGSVWLMWTLFGNRGPVLERDSILVAGVLLPVAGTTFLVAFYSVLRQRKAPELLPSKPADRNARTLGVQLGTFGPTAAAAVLMIGVLAYLASGDPIGELLFWELVSGLLVIPAVGIAGTALARWLPHPIVAPVALVALAVLQFWASPDFEVFQDFAINADDVTANFEWTAPWMAPASWSPPDIMSARPGDLHATYLFTFALVLVYLTQERKGRGRAGQIAVASVFVVALIGVSLSLPAHSLTVDWREAADAQICEVRAGVEYCALSFYEGWIPRWEETVAAVDDLAPVGLESVVQRPHNIGFEPDPSLEKRVGLALATLEWDRPGSMPEQQFSLALMAAETSVGLPAIPQIRRLTEEEIASIVEQNPGYPGDLAEQLGSRPEGEQSCSGVGQARTVAAIWLAGAATPDGVAIVDRLLERRPDSDLFSLAYIEPHHRNGVTIGRPDAVIARQMLDRPQAEVRSTLLERWDDLVDPDTTSADLASWFGLAQPNEAHLDFHEGPCL